MIDLDIVFAVLTLGYILLCAPGPSWIITITPPRFGHS